MELIDLKNPVHWVYLISTVVAVLYVLTQPMLCLMAATISSIVLAILLLKPQWLFSDEKTEE